jgi:DNA topoisomerase-2
MAQDYVGSNNINLLMPNGQFGTRILGGDDCASARYIHTELNPIVDKLFPKTDFPILKYVDDDGYLVEPNYYVPVIPMALINGGQGIGTGFSMSLPKYNPEDIVNNLKRKANGQEALDTYPWFKGFKGSIVKKNDVSYITKGKYHKVDEDTICVTELPVGMWTQNFKNLLEILSGYDIEEKKKKSAPTKGKKKSPQKPVKEKVKKEAIIHNYRDNSDESKVEFTIKFKEFVLEDLEGSVDSDGINGVEKELKLTTTKMTNLNNIHLYNRSGLIQKYSNINEIIDEFYNVRISLYARRKDYILDIMSKDLQKINAKVEFIKGIIGDKIIINKQKKRAIIEQLVAQKFPLIYTEQSKEHIIDLASTKLTEKEVEKIYTSNKYDYLIKLPIDSLTEEKIEELEKLKKDLEMEIDSLKNKTIKEMYINELNEFMKAYKKINKDLK